MTSPSCFFGEGYASDLDLTKDTEAKINLGALALKSLFHKWTHQKQATINDSENFEIDTTTPTSTTTSNTTSNANPNHNPNTTTSTTSATISNDTPVSNSTTGSTQVNQNEDKKTSQKKSIVSGFPSDTIFFISEEGDNIKYSKTVGEINGHEILPRWLETCLLKSLVPVNTQDSLALQVIPDVRNADKFDTTPTKLTAKKMVRIKALIAFICKKFPVMTEDQVEIWCDNTKLPHDMTLYSVRTLICKSSDFQLTFLRVKPQKKK